MTSRLPCADTMPRRVWHVGHVAATLLIPWVFAAGYFFFRPHPKTITDEADYVADYHMNAAIVAVVLLFSTVGLRVSGRKVAATIPFAITWILVIAYCISQVEAYGAQFKCDVELCMPDFGIFITAVPFAVMIGFAVLGSIAADRAYRYVDSRSQDHPAGP